MTVKELRKFLEAFPDNAVVLTRTTGDTIEPYRCGRYPVLRTVQCKSYMQYDETDYSDLGDWDARDYEDDEDVVLGECQAVVL